MYGFACFWGIITTSTAGHLFAAFAAFAPFGPTLHYGGIAGSSRYPGFFISRVTGGASSGARHDETELESSNESIRTESRDLGREGSGSRRRHEVCGSIYMRSAIDRTIDSAHIYAGFGIG